LEFHQEGFKQLNDILLFITQFCSLSPAGVGGKLPLIANPFGFYSVNRTPTAII
jgi:hypothetical protein